MEEVLRLNANNIIHTYRYTYIMLGFFLTIEKPFLRAPYSDLYTVSYFGRDETLGARLAFPAASWSA